MDLRDEGLREYLRIGVQLLATFAIKSMHTCKQKRKELWDHQRKYSNSGPLQGIQQEIPARSLNRTSETRSFNTHLLSTACGACHYCANSNRQKSAGALLSWIIWRAATI